jgi:nucleotidyltransferase/DNA polymerase involved in DNA repair
MSQRVMKILEGFTPHTEPYSIDEAFMNFDGMQMKIRIKGLAKVAVQCSADTFVVKIATFAKPKTFRLVMFSKPNRSLEIKIPFRF